MILLLTAWLVLPVAHAQTAPATAVPTLLPAVASALTQPRLAGQGRYTYWGFDIYLAQLWVEPGFDSATLGTQRYALELRYLRSFKGRDIAQRSIDEMRRIGSFSEAQGQQWLQAMTAAFPDVVAGDRLTGIHLPGRGAQFLVNGRPTAMVADPEFARLFFGIWLSDKTPEPRLRQTLLPATEP